MNGYEQPHRNRFRPPLIGCVAKDIPMAKAVERCYANAFSSIAENIYRSLMTAQVKLALSELFEEIAREELEQFTLLGELAIALGGSARLRALPSRPSVGQREKKAADRVSPLLSRAIDERTCNVDCYQTLMSRTGDRVVRSIFASLISGEESMREKLNAFANE